MYEETLAKVTQDNKRKGAEKDQSSAQEPPTKQQKSETLVSKTAKSIEKVLGACEEVQKFEKQNRMLARTPNQDITLNAMKHILLKCKF